jgi:hypothetical protein
LSCIAVMHNNIAADPPRKPLQLNMLIIGCLVTHRLSCEGFQSEVKRSDFVVTSVG